MASLAELNESFAIPDVLSFDEPHPGLLRARVTSPACTAELFLYGAHLTHWQPAGTEPVLWLSPRSAFEPGKPIRGGVPVIFPWFAARSVEVTGGRTDGPSHGFARTQSWELGFAAQMGEDVHLALRLPQNEISRTAGFDNVRLALEFTFGRTLTMRMLVGNDGEQPLVYEQALHTYFHLADVVEAKLYGLAGTEFLDKTDGFKRKTQASDPLTITGETDRPYLNTNATVTIEDPGLKRRIVVAKGGSKTTVVWNPWQALAEKLPDVGPDVWHEYVCVETANAAENRVELLPHAAHVMETKVSVEPLPA